MFAWGAKKLFETSMPPGRCETPGIKRIGLVMLLLWQELQLIPTVRAGSPKMNVLSNAMSPRAMRTVSRSSTPRAAMFRTCRGRGSCLLMLLPGGSFEGSTADASKVGLREGQGASARAGSGSNAAPKLAST